MIMYFPFVLTAYTSGATPTLAARSCKLTSLRILLLDFFVLKSLIAYSRPDFPLTIKVVPSLPFSPLILPFFSICARDNFCSARISCLILIHTLSKPLNTYKILFHLMT